MIISPSLITAELLPPIGRSIGNSPPPGIRGAPRMPGDTPTGEFSNGGSGEDYIGINRIFLGYTMTAHKVPRLRGAPTSVARLKDKLRALWRQGRGRSLDRTIEDLAPVLTGWIAY